MWMVFFHPTRNFTQEEWSYYFPGEPYRQTCAMWPEGE
jgi:hypothetical protein